MDIDDVPSEKRLIGSRWVFKKKPNGIYRARLVALGYLQTPGVDYTESYAPVIQDTTFRMVLLIMLVNNLTGMIGDIETAFLNGKLEETIFMKLPDAYTTMYPKCY